MRAGVIVLLSLAAVFSSGAGELLVTWQDNSNNETGFRIERKDPGAGWLALAVTGPDAELYRDFTTDPGTIYIYRVFAYNSAGLSNPSNEYMFMTPDVPAAPGALGVELVQEAGRLEAVSTRQPFDGSVLIVGFRVSLAPVRVVVRAVGPGLEAFGITDALQDPAVQVVGGASNDDWGGDLQLVEAFARLGMFQLQNDSKDAALVTVLEPGNHTIHVTAPAGQVGQVLIEAYQLPLEFGQ